MRDKATGLSFCKFPLDNQFIINNNESHSPGERENADEPV